MFIYVMWKPHDRGYKWEQRPIAAFPLRQTHSPSLLFLCYIARPTNYEREPICIPWQCYFMNGNRDSDDELDSSHMFEHEWKIKPSAWLSNQRHKYYRMSYSKLPSFKFTTKDSHEQNRTIFHSCKRRPIVVTKLKNDLSFKEINF